MSLPENAHLDYLIVVDLEATCDRIIPGKPRYHNEIIEFPAVVVDIHKRQIIDRLEQFVRPAFNSKLTPFCKNLTGITQAEVDGGRSFVEAFKVHQKFVGKYPNSIILSMGDWDLKTMLPQDAWENWVDIPAYYRKWINIKVPFTSMYHTTGGMELMLKRLRLPLLGKHHRGIDDCINIAQIVIRMLNEGWKPRVTSRYNA